MALDFLGPSWNISEEGLKIITESNSINDRNSVLKNALNSDLKEIGKPILAKILNKNCITDTVLQIQKIRNVSAPKANENSQAAPRMLKLVLTDGESYIQGIEVVSMPSLNLDKTAPGTKVLVKSAKISSGYVLLNGQNCTVLGGKVPALFEKWEVARSVQSHSRQNYTGDGPPQWVNFGGKIQADSEDKSFKSLEDKSQDVKENSKFDLQRQDAIAEAASGAVKKVFGGAVTKPVVQQHVAINANGRGKKPYEREQKSKNKNNNGSEVEDRPQKPPERVSLFDFLEDKLRPSDENANKQEQKSEFSNTSERREEYRTQKFDYRPPRSGFKPPYSNFEPQRNDFKPQRNEYKPPRPQTSFEPQRNDNFKIDYYRQERTKPEFKQKRNYQPPQPENNVNGLSENFDKMSLNTQFASRSLRQHLNLGPQKKNLQNAQGSWNVGEECLAKYWEDGKHYHAIISAVTETTYVVQFKGYGNIEEVLKNDCLPVTDGRKPHYTGSMEFRRSVKPYRRQ